MGLLKKVTTGKIVVPYRSSNSFFTYVFTFADMIQAFANSTRELCDILSNPCWTCYLNIYLSTLRLLYVGDFPLQIEASLSVHIFFSLGENHGCCNITTQLVQLVIKGINLPVKHFLYLVFP